MELNQDIPLEALLKYIKRDRDRAEKERDKAKAELEETMGKYLQLCAERVDIVKSIQAKDDEIQKLRAELKMIKSDLKQTEWYRQVKQENARLREDAKKKNELANRLIHERAMLQMKLDHATTNE